MRKKIRDFFEDSHLPMMLLVVPKKRNALIDGLYTGTAYKMVNN